MTHASGITADRLAAAMQPVLNEISKFVNAHRSAILDLDHDIRKLAKATGEAFEEGARILDEQEQSIRRLWRAVVVLALCVAALFVLAVLA